MKSGFFGPKLPFRRNRRDYCEIYSLDRTDMYETHFGLKKRPFRALAAGTDVFVGPQTASTMAGLKKALTAPDSIVAVSGPVGVGKTTIVRRALEAVGDNQVIISVGRMQLGHDEVLELLLEEMGAKLPAGTVQRFTTFRRLLKQHADDGRRVFFVVEDAALIGIDALSELEALTASDAGVSEGANVILMGDQELSKVLKAPRLLRLKQRLRVCQSISTLSASELMGYFKHCFRLAGNEFDAVFEHGTSALLHELSDGIPRMANNLVESALVSAAENGEDRVSVDIVRRIAKDEYGLESKQAQPVEAAPVPESVEVAEVTTVPDNAPVEEDEDDAIPEFIQDTLPDLEILAPALAKHGADANETDLPDLPEIPERSEQPESEGDDVPEWERDPTLAQLRPDLDALEHAMAVAQGLEPDMEDDAEQSDESEKPPELVPEITLDKAIQEKIEESAEQLRLAEEEAAKQEESESDSSDKGKIQTPKPDVEAAPRPVHTPPVVTKPARPATPAPPVAATPVPPLTPAVPVVASPEPPAAPTVPVEPVAKEPDLPVLELPAAPVEEQVPVPEDASDQESEKEEKKAEADLEKIAANLARAKTIDDCDDEMAETLFGEEFSLMAAQVAANAPPELSANDEIEPTPEDIATLPVADLEGAAAVNVDLESEPNGTGGTIDLASTQQRLDTVRALNASPARPSPKVEAVAMSHYEPPPPPPPAGDQPESIEDQINTSITQTLKALSVRPAPAVDDDEDDEKSGFFGRFRRS